MSPTADALYAVIDGTWAPATQRQVGPWLVREGCGGGQRVSATTANGTVIDADIPMAETAMRALGQPLIFMIRPGDEALDAALAARGYQVVDPVNLYVIETARLAVQPVPRVTCFDIWEPLAVMREIWAAGGIGPARLAVMHRVTGPKTAIFGRLNEKPGGTAFVAGHAGVAMVHAVEILPHQRRQGLGRFMMYQAAKWAEREGLRWMSVLCVEDNAGANGLYKALGMLRVTGYHYRRKPD